MFAPDKTMPRPRLALWVEAFRQPSVWRRAILIGLPVGFLQAALNQGDFWWRHAVDRIVIAKTLISPVVAFSAVLISAGATYVERQRSSSHFGGIHETEKLTNFNSSEEKSENSIPSPGNYDRIEI